MKENTKPDLYDQRGVSSQKDEVHKAIAALDKGIYPDAFCKILPDYLAGDNNFCNISHADGAGTKSSLAYAYWKETGDLSVFKGIAQDVSVMNLDDLLCVGVTNEPILFTSSIERNKGLVTGEVLAAIIEGTEEFIQQMKKFGINIIYAGGETADVGDLVRTLTVNGTMTTRMERSKVIIPNIQPRDVIVGLSSYGQASYEKEFNSGIGSNGLTSARHDIFHKTVGDDYPETYDSALDEKIVYCGEYLLTDEMSFKKRKTYTSGRVSMTMGKAVLSPTRTYAPVLIDIFSSISKNNIHGVIHCSGGGQTKVLKFIEGDVRIIKDFAEPNDLFKIIQSSSKTPWEQMYSTFNMGYRMEIYCSRGTEYEILAIARHYGIQADVIGEVIQRNNLQARLAIKTPYGTFHY